MKQSTKDNVEGKMYQVKGKTKEVAGKVINDHELKTQGRIEHLGGDAQEKLGEAEKAVGK